MTRKQFERAVDTMIDKAQVNGKTPVCLLMRQNLWASLIEQVLREEGQYYENGIIKHYEGKKKEGLKSIIFKPGEKMGDLGCLPVIASNNEGVAMRFI